MNLPQALPGYYSRNLEVLKGRNDPDAARAVAKEMEALFAYEMIKAMRATTGMGGSNSLEKDTYMSMFDMELARLLAEKGLGTQEMLVKGLTRGIQKSEEHEDKNGSRELRMVRPGTSLKREINLLPIRTSTQEAKKPLPHQSETLHLPVEGTISSRFGLRKHPIYGDKRFHHGVDIAAPVGTDIYPVKDGTVLFSGQQQGYGNIVIIDHGDGLVSKYAHNKINLVEEGDTVDTNTVIAQVGSSGRSTGPHLHFELGYNGELIDPVMFLAKQ
ncbi:MAG TPA: peptidoglycan DD-metalloendopeptidase family protein [Thermodesulfovibrionales bacterium]|jgi:murein DD-endopeptidase MepM/ murein hydrolase activator NlpD|nr:peptidoglycan DD-metalloendopeptidase family protein [Thermodesulfovibrionales bacterium]